MHQLFSENGNFFGKSATNSWNSEEMRYTSLEKFFEKIRKIEKKADFVHFLQNSKSYVISLHVLDKKMCFWPKNGNNARRRAEKTLKKRS